MSAGAQREGGAPKPAPRITRHRRVLAVPRIEVANHAHARGRWSAEHQLNGLQRGCGITGWVTRSKPSHRVRDRDGCICHGRGGSASPDRRIVRPGWLRQQDRGNHRGGSEPGRSRDPSGHASSLGTASGRATHAFALSGHRDEHPGFGLGMPFRQRPQCADDPIE